MCNLICKYHCSHSRSFIRVQIIIRRTMAVAPTRRARTGCRRRGVKRNQTRHHRHMHLTHSQACFRSNLQTQTFFNGAAALVHLMMIPHFIFLYTYLMNENDNAVGLAVMTMLHLNVAAYYQSAQRFSICEQYDFILHDIPPEEEASIRIPPQQNIRFHSSLFFCSATRRALAAFSSLS